MRVFRTPRPLVSLGTRDVWARHSAPLLSPFVRFFSNILTPACSLLSLLLGTLGFWSLLETTFLYPHVSCCLPLVYKDTTKSHVWLSCRMSPHRTLTRPRGSPHCGVEFLSRELYYFICFPFVFLAVLHRLKLLATVGALSDFEYSGTTNAGSLKSRQKAYYGKSMPGFQNCLHQTTFIL